MKQTYRDLAIAGGIPLFREPLHVGRPNIGNPERFLERMKDILQRGWLTNGGPLVKELEARLADFLEVGQCIAVCNATVALEIVTRALGLAGEVIVPSFTFVATAHALQWQQITPVFCDVKPGTHHIDPGRIEELITPRTTGIIGVHLWGEPCDVEALTDIAERRELKLIFDAAHALGCSHHGRMVGSFGEAEVFSLHATKFINGFEGGIIATSDHDLAKKIRLMTNFGFGGYDNVIYIGTNGKMNESSAAMALTNLESIEDFIRINRRTHRAYASALESIKGIRLCEYAERDGDRRNYQYVVVEVNEADAGLSRDELIEVLFAENVLARRYFYPGCHRMEPYRSYYPYARLMLRETEELGRHVMVLPTGTAVGLDEVASVCRVIGIAVANAAKVRARLPGQRVEAAAPREGVAR